MVNDSKLTDRTFSGLVYLISASGIQIVLKIGVLSVLARLISPKEFGLVGIAVIIVEFSKLFSQMGVGPAIVQRKQLEQRHLTTGFTLTLIIGICFTGLLFISAPLFESFFKTEGLAPVVRAISVVFFVDSITLIGQAQMQRNMKFKVIASLEILSYLIGYGAVGIILAYYGYGIWALVIANLAQAVLNSVFVMMVQPFSKRPGFDKRAFKELMFFGGGHTLARIGNFLATQGDNLVVARMLGPVALGFYSRAYQFMVMPAGIIGNSLDRVLFPAMAKVQDDQERLVMAYLIGTSIIAIAAIPISVLFVLLAPEIILVLLGPTWTEVVLPFQILACSLVFRMSYKMSDSLARATGAIYRRAWRQFIYAFAVFAGSYIGHFWGIYGVAFGVSIALLINALLMSHLSIKLTGISWLNMLGAYQHGLLLGSISGIVCYLILNVSRQYSSSHILTLVITLIGVGVMVMIILKFFSNSFISEDQKKLINKLILKRFKKNSLLPA